VCLTLDLSICWPLSALFLCLAETHTHTHTETHTHTHTHTHTNKLQTQLGWFTSLPPSDMVLSLVAVSYCYVSPLMFSLLSLLSSLFSLLSSLFSSLSY